ncbi:MAG: TldD/PmbA family protein [Acidimicrobiales bacterium]
MVLELAEIVVDAARLTGADEAEAFVEQTSAVTVTNRGRQVSSEWAGSCGVGLRVHLGRRMGFAYGTATTHPALLAEAAVHNAREATPDEGNVLPAQPSTGHSHAEGLDSRGGADAADVIDAALSQAEGTRPVARLVEQRRTVGILNSRGVRCREEIASVHLSVKATVPMPSGIRATGAAISFSRRAAALHGADLAREAVRRARLGAAPALRRQVDGGIVFAPAAAAVLLRPIAGLLSADAVLAGRSSWAERIGTSIAAAAVDLTDEPVLPDGPASRSFDAEGLHSRRVQLIRAGVLTGLLHCHASAVRLGTAPTGNAWRESYRAMPQAGATNLVLALPPHPAAHLMELAGRGARIEQLDGRSGIDRRSGRLRLRARGLTIVDGEPAEPFGSAVLSGDLEAFLLGLVAMGDDFVLVPGTPVIGCASVLSAGVRLTRERED